MIRILILFLPSIPLLLTGCSSNSDGTDQPERSVLRVAVTTSTRDSGLLDELVPLFEAEQNARVDLLAVGTGAALKLGEAGDVDVVFVHARAAEDTFMEQGHGTRREDVMYNTFEILGPEEDPASIRDLKPSEALAKIASTGQKFVSRGDNSGTHKRELKLWNKTSERPKWEEYIESGQGMGATLTMADQMNAYILADRGTYLKFKNKIRLVPLISSAESLTNPYGVMVVDPNRRPSLDGALANAFVDFLIAPDTQRRIKAYRIEGEPLFHPLRLPGEN